MLWARENRTIKHWLLFPGGVLFVAGLIFAIIAFGTHKQTADAQVVNFYSGACEGEGWKNPQNSSGEPDVIEEDVSYTQDNAAYLTGATSPLTCYGFTGTLPPQTYHTRVQVRFSWQSESALETPLLEPSVSDDVSEVVSGIDSEVVSDDTASLSTTDNPESNGQDPTHSTTSATTTEFLDNPEIEQGASSSSDGTEEAIENIPPPTPPVESVDTPTETTEPEVTPEPTQSEPETDAPISWLWQAIGATVYAEELSASTTTDSDTLQPTEITLPENTTIIDATTTDPTVGISELVDATSTQVATDSAQFIIEYTLDGMVWSRLGEVTTIANDVRLEFPIEVLPTLSDISNVQIRIVPAGVVDAVPVYVDAVWLEVSYAPLGELGVHSISDIVPGIAPIATVISETESDASSTIPHLTPQDFVNRIKLIHGIDERYVLVTLGVTATSSEVWLFDMDEEIIHHIGSGAAETGIMPAGMKDGMIFWLNATEDKIFTYDLRTAGSLHEMLLVQNLPWGSSYRLTFPFTDWELIWRGDQFYFFSKKTGEVFRDENTGSAQLLFEYFPLLSTLPLERIQDMGLTFITESDITSRETLENTIE